MKLFKLELQQNSPILGHTEIREIFLLCNCYIVVFHTTISGERWLSKYHAINKSPNKW